MILIFTLMMFQSLDVFGLGSISTQNVEYGIAFDNEYQTVYVVRHSGNWGSNSNPPSAIYEYIRMDSVWEYKGVSPFSDTSDVFSESGISISYDGKTALYTTNKTYVGKPGIGDSDIWIAQKKQGKWMEPQPLFEVNRPSYEASPVMDSNGNIYFVSMRENGPGLGDIYISKVINGHYSSPELLSGEVNSEFGEWNFTLSKDGNHIIFESSGRTDGLSSYGDLYISSRKDERWSQPVHLGFINSTGSDLSPRINYKEQTLVFASSSYLSNTDVNFYSIKLAEIGLEYLISD